MTPTSTFPYHSQGPIDFSTQNFVRTEQVERLDASGTLQYVEVKQTYDPVDASLMVLLLITIIVLVTGFWTWVFAKKSR